MSTIEQRFVNLNSNYHFQTTSRLGYKFSKMLVFDRDKIIHSIINNLPKYLNDNTVIVVNDASTLPASIHGKTSDGKKIELRLVYNNSNSFSIIKNWKCIIFRGDNWRKKTEDRDPAGLKTGDKLFFGKLCGKIVRKYPISDRLYDIKFQGENEKILKYILSNGVPIQYSYHEDDLKFWDIQTIFSSRPVALEPSSASFQLNWRLIKRIKKKGIPIIPITHATSISSAGDHNLDKYLPFPEWYEISERAANHLNQLKETGKRILAFGTSVTRALEDNYSKHKKISPGIFVTDLMITERYNRRFINDLFTGMHLPEETHLQLLENFVDHEKLIRGYQSAVNNNYLWHEYGDTNLIINQDNDH